MARAVWKGSLALGLLNVPVALYVANREEKVAFSTVEKATGEKIKMPYVSSVTGDELDRKADVMKQYVFPDGKVVTVTNDEVAMVQPARSKIMQLQGFVPKHSIDPSLYNTAHQIGAGEGGEKGLALLAHAMEDRGLVGVGTYVKGGNEKLIVLRSTGHDMYLHELFWADEVRDSVAGPPIVLEDREMEMADTLVMKMSSEGFDHASYVNTHRDALLAMLARKAEGLGIEPELPLEVESPADLMAQLEASVAAAKGAA